MNQSKECFEFIDAKISGKNKDFIVSILNQIEEKSNKEYWEAPTIGKFPEESDNPDDKWLMWWNTDKFFLELEFYPEDEKTGYYFWRDRHKNISAGEEFLSSEMPQDIIEKILKIKYKKVEQDE